MKKEFLAMIREKDFLTPKEIATIGDVHLKTVRRWLKSGKLPFIQPGGKGCAVLIPKYKIKQEMGLNDFFSK